MQRALCLLGAVALAASACDGADVKNPPPLNSGPASNSLYTPEEVDWSASEGPDKTQVAQSFCGWARGCGLITTASQEAQCMTLAERSFVMLPDPAAFVQCLTAMPCGQLENLMKLIEQCAAIDESSTICQGTSFHYCSKSGTCKDLECSSFCAALGQSGSTCEHDGDECDCHSTDPPPRAGGQ